MQIQNDVSSVFHQPMPGSWDGHMAIVQGNPIPNPQYMQGIPEHPTTQPGWMRNKGPFNSQEGGVNFLGETQQGISQPMSLKISP